MDRYEHRVLIEKACGCRWAINLNTADSTDVKIAEIIEGGMLQRHPRLIPCEVPQHVRREARP